MRLHSDTITSRDIYNATDAATTPGAAAVRPTRLELHGSRKRARAYDVLLTGSNRRGQAGDPRTPAATWDEWGRFLSHLFTVDPRMTCDAYADADEFHDRTDHRFDPMLSGRGQSII